jgi:hypothetical protein
MKQSNLKKSLKFIIVSIVLSFTLLTSFTFADDNGVWHRAEDVRSGTFGDDETSGDYTFISRVFFNQRIDATIIYDLNDPNYYINPNVDSVFNNMNVKGELQVNVIKSNRADGNVVIQLG